MKFMGNIRTIKNGEEKPAKVITPMRVERGGYSVKHLPTGVTDRANSGSWRGWQRGAPAGFLFSPNPGWRPRAAAATRIPSIFPGGIHSDLVAAGTAATAGAVPQPPHSQKRLLVAGDVKSALPQLRGAGWPYPTFADPLIPGFRTLRRCGKSVESFKKQEASKPGLKIPGI